MIRNQILTVKDTVYVTGETCIHSESAVGQSPLFSDKRYYYLSDHLGTIRVVLTETGNVDSWSDYYPFGKEARGSSTVNEPKEQFTGKERDIEIGLDYFGARYYNYDIGRWMCKDPLSGKYPGLSPYNYAANNPIYFVDPNGKDIHESKALSENKNYQKAKEVFLSTEAGKKIYTEMMNNKDILVVLTGGDVWGGEGATRLASEVQNASEFTIDEGKETVYNEDGKIVISVVLDEVSLSKNDPVENSETAYHEFKAHVEDYKIEKDSDGKRKAVDQNDSDKDHKRYGREGSEKPRSGSSADKYLKQAKKVYDQIRNKNNEEEKKK